MARKTPKTPKLTIRRAAHKRSSYLERTGASSRAAQTLVAAANGHGEHWSHDDIRSALLRQCAVEIDELVDELPRPAILHAVTKGWIHKSEGDGWFRVTRRAAIDLNLPAKNGAGQRIAFLDATKLPPSLPAFEEPKKAVLSDERAGEILAALIEPRDVLAQAKLYQAAIDETGWAPAEIARRLATDPAQISSRWDDVIYHVNVLALEPEYQAAVGRGQLSLKSAYELFRVPAKVRPALFAAFAAGKSRAAVRKLAVQLVASC